MVGMHAEMAEKPGSKVPHWSEQLAQRVMGEKKAPLVITGGMTTSGPAHMGTVCEFLYPYVLKMGMEALGAKPEMHFVGDIMDAFDGIPAEMKNTRQRSLQNWGNLWLTRWTLWAATSHTACTTSPRQRR